MIFIHAVCPFDVDAELGESSWQRLKAVDLPVATPLREQINAALVERLNPTQVSRILNITMNEMTPECYETLLKQCDLALLFNLGPNPLPQIWRSLFEVLGELHLEELSHKIEIFLTSKLSGA